MSNTKLVTFANGGHPLPLSLERMRYMRQWIWEAWHDAPAEIRAPAVQLRCYAQLTNATHFGRLTWDGIPLRLDEVGAMSADSMQWISRSGELMGVMRDLEVPNG